MVSARRPMHRCLRSHALRSLPSRKLTSKSAGLLAAIPLVPLREAEDWLVRALFLFRELKDAIGIANALTSLGEMELRPGERRAAAAYFGEALDLWRSIGPQRGVETITAVAALLADDGQVVTVDLDEGAGIGDWDIRAARHALTSVSIQISRRPMYKVVTPAMNCCTSPLSLPEPADFNGGNATIRRLIARQIIALTDDGVQVRGGSDW